MAIINGTANNDTLTVQSDTTSVQAGAGTDTVVFSGNYADYTFSQSDSFVPLMTNNATGQVVSLFDVGQLIFNDKAINLQITGDGEFQINTYIVNGQENPSITALADGGFVVTWDSYGQDSSDRGTFAQIYNADGTTQGNEFQVNTFTVNGQQNPSIAALTDGGFVVTWNSYYQDVDVTDVYAQIYNADGSTQGNEFQVSTNIGYWQGSPWNGPSITGLSNGGFVITWTASEQDLTTIGIYAQMYNVDGTAQGSEFQVNTYHSNFNGSSKKYASITALADGGFVVTWDSYGQDGDSWGIYAQIYNADGTIQGNEFQVNTYTESSQDHSSITSLTTGGFVITWQSDDQDGDNIGIYAQMYNADGAIQGNEFQVNTYTEGNQGSIWNSPSIAGLSNGRFVITWQSEGQDNSYHNDIFAQIYNADGTTNGNEFQVNTYTIHNQEDPSITALNDGGFIITWDSWAQDGSDFGVYAQRYDSEGNPLGVTTLSEITDSADALVSSTSGLLLNNLTLHHYKDGLDTGVSTLIEQGRIEVNTDVVFDYVVFEPNNIYSDNLNILDLYGVLDNIGQTIDTHAEHASDMDNNGVINILDLYDALDGIGKAPQTFDLVDQDGNLVTGLNTDLADIANWTLVANGDVNMSGGFEDAYLVQNQPPTISGTTTGSVVEDSTSTALGTLTASDPEGVALTYSIVSGSNTYGSASINATTGEWTYTLSDSDTDTDSLTQDQSASDTFVVRATESTGSSPLSVETTVNVGITGTNDAPVISGTSTGSVTEDGTNIATGTIISSDVDTGDTAAYSGNLTGTYGAFAVNTTTGAWTYTLNNSSSAVQSLNAGETLTETFIVTVKDSQDAADTQDVVITINGADEPNQPPTISGTTTGSVVEDSTSTASGALTASDPEGVALTYSIVSGSNTYGSASINATTGVWTYTLSDSDTDTDSLTQGQSASDAFVVQAIESTGSSPLSVETTVNVGITGTNDAPVISGTSTGSVTEDGASNTISGSLVNTDPDGPQAAWSVGNAQGTYGSIAINQSGQWTYTLDNDDDDLNNLDAGQTATETFELTLDDGSGTSNSGDTQTISVTVNGATDTDYISDDYIVINRDDIIYTGSGAETDTYTISLNNMEISLNDDYYESGYISPQSFTILADADLENDYYTDNLSSAQNGPLSDVDNILNGSEDTVLYSYGLIWNDMPIWSMSTYIDHDDNPVWDTLVTAYTNNGLINIEVTSSHTYSQGQVASFLDDFSLNYNMVNGAGDILDTATVYYDFV